MADALRTLLAEFIVQVKGGEDIAKADASVNKLKLDSEALTSTLVKLQAAAQPIAKSINDVFARAGAIAGRNVQALNAAAFGGRQDNGGFGAAGAAAGLVKAKVAADAAANSFGSRLSRGFDRARLAAANLGAKLTRGGGGSPIGGLTSLRAGIIGLATGAVAGFAKRAIDSIGGIGEAAAKLGVTNAEFQRLDVLAKQNATSVESLGTAFRNLGRVAGDPTKESAGAFAALGVDTKGADGQLKSRQDLFFETAGALADVANETKRAQLATQLFGRSGTELLPMLAGGRAGLEAQRAALMKMSVVSDDAIKKADEFGDNLEVLKTEILAGLAPALVKLIPLFRGALEFAGKFVRPLSGIVAAIEAMATASGPSGASGAIMLLKGAFSALLGVFKGVEDFIVFLAGGDSVIGNALEKAFGTDNPVLNTIKAFFDGIFGGFGEIAAFLAGETSFEEFGDRFLQVTADMATAIDDFVAHVISKIPIVGNLVNTFGKLQSGDVLGAAGSFATAATSTGGSVVPGAGIAQGLGAQAAAWLNSGFDTIANPGAASAPAVVDQRTQTVQVNVGSTAEVAGAVQGAQRGMGGRDGAAVLAQVSAP